jgi:hypothetical protein
VFPSIAVALQVYLNCSGGISPSIRHGRCRCPRRVRAAVHARGCKLPPALLLQSNGLFFNRFSSVLFTEKLILLPPSYLPNQVASLISSFLHCTPGTAVSVASCLREHRCHTSPRIASPHNSCCFRPYQRRRTATLARFSIPSSSTILAAFSRPAKVDSGTFTAWLTALRSAGDALLLLIDFNSEGVQAMQAAAAASGVDMRRIVAVPTMAEGAFSAPVNSRLFRPCDTVLCSRFCRLVMRCRCSVRHAHVQRPHHRDL